MLKRRCLLPCGVDIGISGGFGLIDEREILLACQVTGEQVKRQEIEGNYKKLTAKEKRKLRYVNMVLKPGNTRVFASGEMLAVLDEAKKLARERGYAGIFVLVEQPQTFGAASLRNYITTGGSYHGWINAINTLAIKWGEVSPSHWKSALKLTSDKQASIEAVKTTFNNADRKIDHNHNLIVSDHNVCEALLLAWWLHSYANQWLNDGYYPKC